MVSVIVTVAANNESYESYTYCQMYRNLIYSGDLLVIVVVMMYDVVVVVSEVMLVTLAVVVELEAEMKLILY